MVSGLCAMLAFFGTLHAQDALKARSNLPIYLPTGNEAADGAAYDHAKRAWIQTHSAEYQAYLGQIQHQEVAVSPAAYVNSPWKSAGEKDRMIAQHPDRYKAETSGMAAGKIRIDKRDFAKVDGQQQLHILSHPERYEVIEHLNPTH